MTTDADLARLRALVAAGDPAAIAALRAWEAWQQADPSRPGRTEHHLRRLWERRAAAALAADRQRPSDPEAR